MSKRLQSDHLGVTLSSVTCPLGLRISVPEITTEEALPWYPTGRCNQLGYKALSGPLNITPTL